VSNSYFSSSFVVVPGSVQPETNPQQLNSAGNAVKISAESLLNLRPLKYQRCLCIVCVLFMYFYVLFVYCVKLLLLCILVPTVCTSSEGSD